jgi:peroxiredoxin
MPLWRNGCLMDSTFPAYYISRKMGLMLLSFMLILVSLSLILVKQNLALKASLRARVEVPKGLKLGTAVPALEGKDLSGNKIAVGYDAGGRKTILLSFSPQCSFCEKNMPNWEAIIKGADKNAFRVIGLSLSSLGLEEYVARHNFADTPLMTEINAGSRFVYKLGSTPQTILIDASGKVEKVWTGWIKGEVREEVEQSLGVKLPSDE